MDALCDEAACCFSGSGYHVGTIRAGGSEQVVTGLANGIGGDQFFLGHHGLIGYLVSIG